VSTAGGKPDVSERYITAAELGRIMGISIRSVRRLTAAGMPSENWGMARTRRFLASECIAWASAPRENTVADHPPRTIVKDNPPGQRANAARGSEPTTRCDLDG
jgi:hypothetical protein